jgi:hypothetical protein
MMAARVQTLIAVTGETITYKRGTHGSYSTATLQSTPSVQSYTIKAGVRQYRAREIAGLVQRIFPPPFSRIPLENEGIRLLIVL